MPRLAARSVQKAARKPASGRTRLRDDRRSTNPCDYQSVARPLAAMAKRFPDRFEIPEHHHPRDQLLFAVEGVMRVTTARQAWLVPPDRAVYVPGGIPHKVAMRGDVAMRTLYIAGETVTGMPTAPTAIIASDLLRALILAFLDEPIDYDEGGRGGLLTRLILDEIRRSPPQALAIPLPRDARLQVVCDALLADPSDRRTLDAWAGESAASARTLARLFEREVGMPFAVWRQRLRFHNAVESIVAGEPIAEVARRNGYRSPSAFSAAFRQAMGMSPSAMRPAVISTVAAGDDGQSVR